MTAIIKTKVDNEARKDDQNTKTKYSLFLQILSNYGTYILKCSNRNKDSLISVVGKIKCDLEIERFATAYSIFLQNCYLRGIDIDAGDNIALKASYVYTKDSIQKQLNRHHFGSTTSNSLSCNPYSSLENFFNIHAVKYACDVAIAVICFKYALSGKQKIIYVQPDPCYIRDLLLSVGNSLEIESANLVTILDFKHITKSIEGILMLQAGYTLLGANSKNTNTTLLCLNQATRSSTIVPMCEELSPITRNGNEKIHNQRSALVIAAYEDSPNKIRKLAKCNAIDNLQDPISRTLVGMPSKTGMTNFDLLFSE